MRAETKYYAYDDTEFESEDECLLYEKRLRGSLCGARFFDVEGREITFDPDNPEEIDDAMYCHIVDDKVAPALFNWLRDYADLPDGELKNNDLWWFDTLYLEWVNVTEELKVLTGVVKKIEDAERKGAD
jgi:hypothetical protein